MFGKKKVVEPERWVDKRTERELKPFIYAGAYHEAEYFANTQGWSKSDWNYISDGIHGLVGFHPRLVIFIGTYINKHDFYRDYQAIKASIDPWPRGIILKL